MRADINFFTPYQGQRKEERNNNIYIYSLLGFLSIVIVGTLIYNSVNITLVNKKIADYQEQLNAPEIQEKIKESDIINKKISILGQYDKDLQQVLKSVNSRDVVSTNLLNMLSGTLPSEVSFNSINITKTDITIQAVSTSRTAIGEIQHNLKELNNIQDVYIGSISGDEEFTFDIKCVLKDVE